MAVFCHSQNYSILPRIHQSLLLIVTNCAFAEQLIATIREMFSKNKDEKEKFKEYLTSESSFANPNNGQFTYASIIKFTLSENNNTPETSEVELPIGFYFIRFTLNKKKLSMTIRNIFTSRYQLIVSKKGHTSKTVQTKMKNIDIFFLEGRVLS